MGLDDGKIRQTAVIAELEDLSSAGVISGRFFCADRLALLDIYFEYFFFLQRHRCVRLSLDEDTARLTTNTESDTST